MPTVVALVDDTAVSVSETPPPLPPPPAILMSTVVPDTANVFPAPIKFNVVNQYPITPALVFIPTPGVNIVELIRYSVEVTIPENVALPFVFIVAAVPT